MQTGSDEKLIPTSSLNPRNLGTRCWLNVEEFLCLDLPEGQEYELVNGIVTPMSEPSGEHQNLRSELLVELRLESRRCQLGLLVHPSPLLELGPKDTRKPYLIAINRDSWNRQTQ